MNKSHSPQWEFEHFLKFGTKILKNKNGKFRRMKHLTPMRVFKNNSIIK